MLEHILKGIGLHAKPEETNELPSCPVCGSTDIRYDSEHQEYVCQNCGEVLGELVNNFFIKEAISSRTRGIV